MEHADLSVVKNLKVFLMAWQLSVEKQYFITNHCITYSVNFKKMKS